MGIFDRNVPGSTGILSRSTVGIAGCGGLGSQAALSLARAGIGRLILVDFDRVQDSDLNRQLYFLEDVGRLKTEALSARLRSVNPEIRITARELRLDPAGVAQVFAEAEVLIEAFDRAESKRWLIEAWCRAFPDRPVVAASGVSGLGKTGALRVRRSGRIVMCGDGESDLSEGLCAPRVAIVANMQANAAVEFLVRRTLEECGGPHADRQ
ncbi:MAG TPA: sulfur carrier protein ThiS adenylyltransferase ThiF [Candidatus Saccharimonadales bacterium]|nr:sulfur carrier protein ThiS adenylyltransferase ThiF [Candidatus Saccharimonadales bacterium]